MSAIVATEMVESAFERARNAVLRCSDRISERVFEGISLRDLTVAECKSLVLTINARLSKSDMRCWSTNTAKLSLYRGRCSNNGAAGRKGPLILNSRRSSKCGCKAAFVLDVERGSLTFINHALEQQHHADCIELSPTELKNKAHVFRGLQSPEQANLHLFFATSIFTDDCSTSDKQATRLINGQLRRVAMDANEGILSAGTQYSAPKAYTDGLIRAGKAAAKKNKDYH